MILKKFRVVAYRIPWLKQFLRYTKPGHTYIHLLIIQFMSLIVFYVNIISNIALILRVFPSGTKTYDLNQDKSRTNTFLFSKIAYPSTNPWKFQFPFSYPRAIGPLNLPRSSSSKPRERKVEKDPSRPQLKQWHSIPIDSLTRWKTDLCFQASTPYEITRRPYTVLSWADFAKVEGSRTNSAEVRTRHRRCPLRVQRQRSYHPRPPVPALRLSVLPQKPRSSIVNKRYYCNYHDIFIIKSIIVFT